MKLPPPLQPQGLEANTPANEVKQKMYDLSPELTTETVKKFKGVNTLQSSSQNTNQRVASVDVRADSSIWILEAALNYDFDKIPNGSETFNDSCSYEVDYINNNVTAADLTNAYNYFNQYIGQKTNGADKVKVIDITAYFNNTKITYVANITLFPDLAQKITGLCDAYRATYSANWSNYWVNQYGGCSTGTTNDGPTNCESKANCYVAITCPGFYWSNVTTLNLIGAPYSSSSLFYSHSSNYCQTISGTTLNNYVSACISLGASNIPSSPANMHVASHNVIDNVTLDQQNMWLLYFWWDLDVTYGTYNCSGENDRVSSK